jgi:hypothetical protein
VVQSGLETSAETCLKNFFLPVWNSETDICYGIGKHGDDSKTRANKRSPWDTLHPGRPWAASTDLEDAFPEESIRKRVALHFDQMNTKQTLYPDVQAVLDAFLDGLRA